MIAHPSRTRPRSFAAFWRAGEPLKGKPDMTSVLAERVLYETKPSGCPAYRVSAFELEGVRRVVVRCWERPASEGRHESQADSLNLRESSIAGLLDALEKAAP